MASEKNTYPRLPEKAWWILRKKFNQSIPPQVTPSYLVAVLGGKEASAKSDVLRPLIVVGLVDQDGATTNRAKLWRDNNSYSDVCKEIREALYPPDLLNAIPGPSIDKDAAKRWFMTSTGCGEKTARKMAGLYSLLVEADPAKGDEVADPKSKNTTLSKLTKKPREAILPEKPDPLESQGTGVSGRPINGLQMPGVSLNVEIRIDASTTPEQIDLIFASMAKHLYRHKNDGR